MSVDIKEKLMTADELLALGDVGRCELIYGELVMMSPAGFSHGEIAARLGMLLLQFVESKGLGIVLAAETGFKVESDPDLVRAPDVSFVRQDRVPPGRWRKYLPGVPDLAVEVLSPDDTRREIAEKVNMWLVHGTASVWVADPETQTLVIHRLHAWPLRLGMDDRIESEPALPGLSLEVPKVYRRP